MPLQKKLATLEELYRQPDNPYSDHELCEALGVARGTFYNHIFRRADRSKREEEQAKLMLQMQQIFDDSQQRFGAEKIRSVLAQNGVQVSTKRVSAIMQELDLQSIRSDAKQQYKKGQQYVKRNLLEKEFTVERPNLIWISNITYFRGNNYWVYLCIILDLYARSIVGYRVSRNASTNLVTTTFRNAYRERGKPKDLTFHSDRGKQYTFSTFVHLLQKTESSSLFPPLTALMTMQLLKPFCHIKKEEAYRREYTSEQIFYKGVEQYIRFYNEVRPHRTLKYQTPQAFEVKYYAGFIENKCSNSVIE